MKTEKIIINDHDKEVTLSTYLLDSGGELANTNKRPAVLIMPGGGYTSCSNREGEPIAMAFLSEGYHAFILRYSVGENENYQNAFADVQNALRIILEKSEEWHVDSEKIVAIGFSAGGHLAAALGTMGEIRPNALILGYPCILESMSSILAFPVPSIETKVDIKTPPTFLFSTFEDALVPVENTIRFIDELNKQKIPFEAHIFQKGQHGLSLAKPLSSSGFKANVNENVANWVPMSIAWLKNIFGDFEADSELLMPGVEVDGNEYNLNTAIEVLWNNESCKKLLIEYLPILENEEHFKSAKEISLNILFQYAKDIIDNQNKCELEGKLNKITR